MSETSKKSNVVPSLLIVLVTALAAYNIEVVTLTPTETGFKPETAAITLSAYLLLVVLVEQACDVIKHIFFGHSHSLPSEVPINADKRTRFLVSQMICLILALGVAIAGFRILDWLLPALGYELLKTVPSTNVDQSNLFPRFHYVDVLLSTLLLAGGADRFHQITHDWPYNRPELKAELKAARIAEQAAADKAAQLADDGG